MTVYVDPAVNPYRGTYYCHMWADSEEELHTFAKRLGLMRSWFQQPPKASWKHYDISKNKRYQAVRLGAVETDRYGASYHVAKLANNQTMIDRINRLRERKK